MSNILSPIRSALNSLYLGLRNFVCATQETEATARPRRRVPRRALKFKAVVCVKNRRLRARGVNFSENGAIVITNRPLPVKSVVLVYLKSLRLMGYARVRHCSAWGLWKHTVGLEFGGPLMRERVGWQVEHVDVNTSEWADGEGDPYGWNK
jgi:hypothetical protein